MSVETLQGTSSNSYLDEIREQAAQWVVQLDEAAPNEQVSIKEECERWQSTSPEHRKIFLEIQEMWNAVNSSTESVIKQKHVVGFMMLFLTILTFSLLPWNYWVADYQTRVGEVAEVILPDNSKAYLNTNSAINVNYTNKRRDIVLERGELFVIVNKDQSSRPFSVITDDGNATALGTKYITKLNKKYTSVSVIESTVLIEPKNINDKNIKLSAGKEIDFAYQYLSESRDIKLKNPEWVQNRIAFNNESIDLVIKKLSEYHSGFLYISEEVSDQNLRFTGVLPTDDINLAMSTLATSLKLNAKQLTPYIIWMEKNK